MSTVDQTPEPALDSLWHRIAHAYGVVSDGLADRIDGRADDKDFRVYRAGGNALRIDIQPSKEDSDGKHE